jgi:uncharacterized membrane protein (UPF0182 family)
MKPSQRQPLLNRLPWIAAALIGAAIFAFSIMAVIRGLRLPSSDVASIGLAFGVPLVGLFVLLERNCFPSRSASVRVSICVILSFLLSAASFWIAFIAA